MRRHLLPFAILLVSGACVDAQRRFTSDTGADTASEDGDTSDQEASDGTVTNDLIEPDTAVTNDLVEPDTTVTNDLIEPDTTVVLPCDPPLAFTIEEAWVLPAESLKPTASGGTGEYTYELTDNASGATFMGASGTYTAGPTPGTDLLEVTASGCAGTAVLAVHVVPPLRIDPTRLELPWAARLEPIVSGGSGEYTLVLEEDGSGATIDTFGAYIAGTRDGTDLLAARDDRGAWVARASITVRAGAALALAPPIAYVPVGHQHLAQPSGLSDDYVFTAVGDLTWQDGLCSVEGEGESTLTVEERWTGSTATQSVHALIALDHAISGSPSGTFTPTIATGDLNGDDLIDAVVAVAELSVDRGGAGAAFVYLGTATGLQANPVQTLSGSERGGMFGRGLALADLDGDGIKDLLIGVARLDLGGNSDQGAVHAYHGHGDGTFDSVPSASRSGLRTGDNFGTQVLVCDFDADGFDDLAVSAPQAEDVLANPTALNQGGVHIFLGDVNGWPVAPSTTRWGVTANGTAWAPGANLQLGGTLAAGDLDGDGACDLVAASAGALNNAGVVLVYRGIARTRGAEILSQTPMRGWTGELAGNNAARLGFALAVNDLDGDDKADLVVSQPAWSSVTSASNSAGAVRVIRGGDWLTAAESRYRLATEFEAVFVGTSVGDELGLSVAIGDATGDALPDLIIGAHLDELAGSPQNAGVIYVHPGQSGALPSASAERIISGASIADRLGTGVAALGFPGAPSVHLLGVSRYSDTNGPDVGGAHILALGLGETRAELFFPVAPAPWRVGHAIATLPDLDGDGLSELAVGAPDELLPAISGNDHRSFAGSVSIYRGTAASDGTGFSRAPFQRLRGFAGHSLADRFGSDVAPLGDFDGDDVPDLAVVARSEDRTAQLPTNTYALPTECGVVTLSNCGATFVFRGDGNGAFMAEPQFVLFGTQAEQGLDHVLGPGDLNGDGLDDLVVSSEGLDDGAKNNTGGIQVWFGRTGTAGLIDIGCTPALTLHGRNATDSFGTAMTALGDLDDDGCADFAVGAAGEGQLDRGSIYLVLGGGEACANWNFRIAALTGLADWDAIGSALDAVDLDDDGRPELVVGSSTHRVGGAQAGAVWLIDGRRLVSAAAGAVVFGGAPPSTQLLTAGELAGQRLEGSGDERFGAPVALLRAAGPDRTPLLAVGSANSARTGFTGVSSVLLYPIAVSTAPNANPLLALDREPIALLGGESRFPGVLGLGDLAFALQGGSGVLALGLEDANAHARDLGAVYVAPLEPVGELLSAPR